MIYIISNKTEEIYSPGEERILLFGTGKNENANLSLSVFRPAVDSLSQVGYQKTGFIKSDWADIINSCSVMYRGMPISIKKSKSLLHKFISSVIGGNQREDLGTGRTGITQISSIYNCGIKRIGVVPFLLERRRF